jgi:hypothetical protein
LWKHSFLKSVEEYEKRGVIFGLFSKRVKRVKREKELNAERQSARSTEEWGARWGKADLLLRSG